MNLNMYLGEVQTQTQSMNALCKTTIQGMEQAIQSIDTFVGDAVLQGKTYDSAKIFFAQTFRPLAQGIIYLCEELICQNDAFPSDFQSKVASTDVIEQEILEQIREIERMNTGIVGIIQNMPGMQAMTHIFDSMKRKLQKKLEHLYEFNQTSSSNYDIAIQLAASIAKGLAEVQSGKGFNAASGTFSTQGLNMEWTASIQETMEERARQAEIKEMALKEQEAALKEKEDNRPWYQKTAIGAWGFFQGVCNSVAEANVGQELPMNDELENKKTYQVGNLVGNIVTGGQTVLEVLGGWAIIGGSNIGTVILEGATAGLASPIVLPADVALTAAGAGVVTHGGYIWYNTIQNGIDNLQKFQSSSSSGGRVNKVKENGKIDKEGNATKGTGNAVKGASVPKALKNSDIPNMNREKIIDSVPDNWTINDNNGFAHIKDENGVMRMRIDPPDKITKYDHVHVYDKDGNPLDINGNIVDRKSPDAHIPYKK